MSQTFTSLSLRTLETEQYHTHDFQGLSHVLLCDPLVYKKKSKSIYAIKFTVSCSIQNIFSTFTQNQLHALIIKFCYIMRKKIVTYSKRIYSSSSAVK